MANEIKVSIGVNYANGNLKDNFAQETVQVTQTNQEFTGPVVVVGTSEEDLALPDITTNGFVLLRNLDSTNYVTYGPNDTTMTAFGRLKAGEIHVVRLEPGVTLRWAANTAPVKVQVKAYGN